MYFTTCTGSALKSAEACRSLGSINSALSKKYLSYNPDAANSLSVQGTVANLIGRDELLNR